MFWQKQNCPQMTDYEAANHSFKCDEVLRKPNFDYVFQPPPKSEAKS